MVRRGAGGLDHVHVVLPGAAVGRLRLCPSACSAGFPPATRRRSIWPWSSSAAVVLPILPGRSGGRPDGSNPTWRILLLLAGTVGLPYFALSATSPLVQAWFSGSLPGRSPYRLYALSNFGSLVGAAELSVCVRAGVGSAEAVDDVVGGFLLYAASARRRWRAVAAGRSAPAGDGESLWRRQSGTAVGVLATA